MYGRYAVPSEDPTPAPTGDGGPESGTTRVAEASDAQTIMAEEAAATDATEAASADEWKRRHRIATARYVVLRILRSVFTIFVVATGTFFLVRLLPGSPVDVYINEQMSQYGRSYEEAAAAASALFSFDPNASLVEQYFDYMIALVPGAVIELPMSPCTRAIM